MTRLVPKDKSDYEACQKLSAASDDEVIPHIAGLLECLQDLNWPIAGPVSERLSSLGLELVEPISDIISGNNEVWKYWVVSHLLHTVRRDVYLALLFKLAQIRKNPTQSERDEEVYDEICSLLNSRSHA